jgi:hypothetical protein
MVRPSKGSDQLKALESIPQPDLGVKSDHPDRLPLTQYYPYPAYPILALPPLSSRNASTKGSNRHRIGIASN